MVKNRANFQGAARRAVNGVAKHAVALDLRHITSADLLTALDAAIAADQTFRTARSVQPRGELREARQVAQALVTTTRDYLKPFLGAKWSAHWPQLGFRTPSLRLPRTDAALLHVLDCMEAHFIAQPARANEELGVTAPAHKARRDAFQSALDAMSDCGTRQKRCREARADVERDLEEKLRTLRLELAVVLKPTDPRWIEFTGRVPANPRVPEPVKEVTVTITAPDAVHLAWPRALRAQRYKVYLQTPGVDAAPRLARSTRDRATLLVGLPPEVPFKIRVVPTNTAGDGIACEVMVERKAAA